jgi:hypothetical protein
MMKKLIRLSLFVTILFAGQTWAQPAASPLFLSDEPLIVDLEADFDAVFSSKDDTTEFPARISMTDLSGNPVTLDIQIRARGKTRRRNDICRFHPLRLDFPKKATAGTPFEGQNALKLVTHCDKNVAFEQNTITEYLAYRALNILTDSSLRVRPAMIRYISTGEDTLRKFGFFIEREKSLARRLNGIEIEQGKIHPNLLDPFQTCLVDIFQYMIGNTDYSIHGQHNIFLVSDSVRSLKPIPIPYDFDWSGLVSASYAVPHPNIKAEHVTDRVYRGFRQDPEVIARVIGHFNERKAEIYRLFETYELFDPREAKKAVRYLDGFYKTINDNWMVKREFIDNARVDDRE